MTLLLAAVWSSLFIYLKFYCEIAIQKYNDSSQTHNKEALRIKTVTRGLQQKIHVPNNQNKFKMHCK